MFYSNLVYGPLIVYFAYMLITKKYNLLHVLVFVLPFLSWFYNIGLNLTMFQIIILIIITVNIISTSLGKPKNLFHIQNNYVNVFIFYSIIVTLYMSNYIIEDFQQLGGFFRSEGRFLSQIILWLIYFSLIPIVYNYIKSSESIFDYLKVYLNAIILLILLGWIQYFVYKTSGTDIFPLMLYNDGSAKSGIWQYMGSGLFRISSLGGEPKGFAQSLIMAFFIIHIANKFNYNFFKYDFFLKIIIVVTIFMTLATSGFVLFTILLIVYYFSLLFLGLARIRLNLKTILISLTLIFSTTYMINKNIDFFSSVLSERVLDRNIGSEDYDQPIQDFLLDKPQYSIFGSGMGNIHNLAEKYISSEYKHYMGNTIFVAKSGYLKLISELGFIGLFIFLLINFFLVKSLLLQYKSSNNSIYVIISILLLLLSLGFLARVYLISFYFLILSFSILLSNFRRINN